jgi:hypothetical protein
LRLLAQFGEARRVEACAWVTWGADSSGASRKLNPTVRRLVLTG